MTRKPTREVQRLRALVEEQQREIERMRNVQRRLMREAVAAKVLVDAVREAADEAARFVEHAKE